jgi:dihydroorotate dehydrogenase (fumarate)
METLFETKFAGLTLSNPIIIASSGLTDAVDKNKELEKAGAGALVLKSLFEEQISKSTVEPMLRYFQTNEVNNYLKLIQETKEACRIPVIASINCYKDDSWVEFAHQIETAGADALELNLFSFNTDLDETVQPVEDVYIRVIKKIKEVVRIPVIVKMGKYLSPIVQLVNQFDKIGVAGVVLFNRFYQPDIDINQLQMTSGHVFSTHTDINDTLRWTGIISGKLPQVSIAACTGIHDWESIIKCILSGASAVQICSTVYQNGNEIIPQMKRSMEEWMQGLHFHSLEEFRGKLNYAQIQDPSLYERIQFMRYFSNRD